MEAKPKPIDVSHIEMANDRLINSILKLEDCVDRITNKTRYFQFAEDADPNENAKPHGDTPDNAFLRRQEEFASRLDVLSDRLNNLIFRIVD